MASSSSKKDKKADSKIKKLSQFITTSLKDEKLGWVDFVTGVSFAGIILMVVGGIAEWSLGVVLSYYTESPIKLALFCLTSLSFLSIFFTLVLAKKVTWSHGFTLLSTLVYSAVVYWLLVGFSRPTDLDALSPDLDNSDSFTSGFSVVKEFSCPVLQISSQDFEKLSVLTRENASEIEITRESIPLPHAIVAAFSKDNKRLVFATGQTLCIYTVNQPVPIVRPFRRTITAVSLSHDSRLLTIGLEDGTVGVFELVDINMQDRWHKIEAHEGPVVGLEFSDNDQWLISTSNDGEIKAWEALRIEKQFDVGQMEHGTSDISFTDNNHLVSSDTDGNLYLWELQFNNEQAEELRLNLHDSAITSIAVFGKLIATGDQKGVIRIWDTYLLWDQAKLGESEPLIQFPQHIDVVNSLAFNYDGTLLASGSKDNTIILWDSSSGESLITLTQPSSIYALAFGPDDKLLASTTADGMLNLWGVVNPSE